MANIEGHICLQPRNWHPACCQRDSDISTMLQSIIPEHCTPIRVNLWRSKSIQAIRVYSTVTLVIGVRACTVAHKKQRRQNVKSNALNVVAEASNGCLQWLPKGELQVLNLGDLHTHPRMLESPEDFRQVKLKATAQPGAP